MGRVIRREVAGFRCEVRGCGIEVAATPAPPADTTWHDQYEQLRELVAAGWSLILHPQLRSYCPEHADRAWGCSCRTHPERRHLCTSHDQAAAALVWDELNTPADVQAYTEVYS